MIMINAIAAKYGTISITAAGCIIPSIGPITIPRTIKNAMSGIPVFLKKASPNTPKIITTLAAKSKIGADAISDPPPPEISAITFWRFASPCDRKSELTPVSTGLCSKNDLTRSIPVEPETSLVSRLVKNLSKKFCTSPNTVRKIKFKYFSPRTILI